MALVALGLVVTAPAEAAVGVPCSGMSAPEVTNPGNTAPNPVDDTSGALAGGARIINVLVNDTDAQNDDLFVVSASAPERGEVCVDSNGDIEYFAASSASNYTDHFTYGVTDGDLYRTATVTVNVKGIKPMRASLVHRKTKKRKAQVRFTNQNDRNMVVLAGSPKKQRPQLTRTVGPGKTVGFRTKYKRIVFFAIVRDLDGAPIFVNFGTLNTRNGAQQIINGDSVILRSQVKLRTLRQTWLRQSLR